MIRAVDMKSRSVLITAVKVIVGAVVLLAVFFVGINIWIKRELRKVSIAAHSCPAGLGDVLFVKTTSLFSDIYLAVDLTPGNDGDEFIIGFVDCADGPSFMKAVKSNDGTVIAVRTTAGNANLPEEKGGGHFPFTHAYDFKEQIMIVPSDPSHGAAYESKESCNERASKIFKLLQERGGSVSLIRDRYELDLERLSYSKSKRWVEMIAKINE